MAVDYGGEGGDPRLVLSRIGYGRSSGQRFQEVEMKHAKPLFLVIFACISFHTCGAGGMTGPRPSNSPSPSTPPKSSILITGVSPASGSVVCTGRGVVPFEVGVSTAMLENYPPLALYVVVSLSNDGVNPIPNTEIASSSSILRSDWSLRLSAGGDRSVTLSQFVLARYEYWPSGRGNTSGFVLVSSDQKPWNFTFNWGC
jgi:hypothetical protein